MQVAFFNWCWAKENKYPALRNVFAIPNGGARDVRVAAKMKAEGVRKGVLDVMIAHPSNGLHGLFIEFKNKGRKPTPEQLDWIARLTAAGYQCAVCYSWQEAAMVVEGYLT